MHSRFAKPILHDSSKCCHQNYLYVASKSAKILAFYQIMLILELIKKRLQWQLGKARTCKQKRNKELQVLTVNIRYPLLIGTSVCSMALYRTLETRVLFLRLRLSSLAYWVLCYMIYSINGTFVANLYGIPMLRNVKAYAVFHFQISGSEKLERLHFHFCEKIKLIFFLCLVAHRATWSPFQQPSCSRNC